MERTKLDEGSTGKALHYTIYDGVETATGHKHEGYDDHGNRVSLTAYQYQALSCRKALVFERKQELFCPQAVIFVVFLNQAFCFLCEIDHRTITVFMISRTIGHRYLVRDSSSSGVNTVLPSGPFSGNRSTDMDMCIFRASSEPEAFFQYEMHP